MNGNKVLMEQQCKKYDHNGIIFHPPEEIALYRTSEPTARIDLGIGANTDASGDYTVTVDGTSFTYTAGGADDAATVFADLKTQIETAGYNVSGSLDSDDKFYISTKDGSELYR